METIQEQLQRIEDFLESQHILKKDILTLEEATTYLGQSKSSLYKLTSKKEIPFYVPGGKKIYFRRAELDNWILNSKVIPVNEIEEDIEEYLSRTLKN